MMSPKEKAKELVQQFMDLKIIKLSDYSRIEYPTAVQCVIITVKEIIEALHGNAWQNTHDINYYESALKELEEL
jgi:hypothetical protein